jgi:protein-disulfide isomerase
VPAAEAASGVPADGRALGDPNAPVTVIEYGDYQCPGCGTFAAEAQPRLIQDFVATGKVRLEFRDFAFLGDESGRAAEGAACAADQGQFWRYHNSLYLNQHGENKGAFKDKRLKELGTLLGLDAKQFNACLDKGTHAKAVTKMADEARAAGVTGTPSLFVNGKQISYRGYDSLAAEINAALGGS